MKRSWVSVACMWIRHSNPEEATAKPCSDIVESNSSHGSFKFPLFHAWLCACMWKFTIGLISGNRILAGSTGLTWSTFSARSSILCLAPKGGSLSKPSTTTCRHELLKVLQWNFHYHLQVPGAGHIIELQEGESGLSPRLDQLPSISTKVWW